MENGFPYPCANQLFLNSIYKDTENKIGFLVLYSEISARICYDENEVMIRCIDLKFLGLDKIKH